MSWKIKLRQSLGGGGIGAAWAVVLGLILLLGGFRLGDNLIHLSYDIPFRSRPIKAPNDLVVVYIDDDSHKNLNQPYGAVWDRSLYARLVERLTAEKARAVAFDMVWSDPNPAHPEGDERLAKAIKANGKVVLVGDYRQTPEGGFTLYGMMDSLVDGAAGYGMGQLNQDQDFEARKQVHVPPDKDMDIISSFTWELARVAGAKYARDPKERFRERWFNYYGPQGILPNVSFEHAIVADDYCPARFFSNKVVIVGAYLKTYFSSERKDEFRTPYTREGFFEPGVDVQATQVLNLLHGDWLTRTSGRAEIILIIAGGILFGFGLSMFRPIIAMALALAGAALVTLTAHLLFHHERLWFPWMIIVAAQIPVALLWSVVFNSVQLYVQNKLFEQSLQMYLSPKLVKKLSANRDLLKVGAKKQLLTVLFTDIASFTSISEGMEGDELAHHMNKYFQTAVNQCIFATDGTIVKYIGDAIFAFWNAPEDQVDHAMLACEAALRFRDQPPQFMNGRQLVTRLGLHTGEANVGNFGSTARVDYTALGENINLASRMEGLNKYLGTIVLITGETHAGIKGRLVTRFIGDFQLKGFEKAVAVHELVGQPDKAEACRPVHEAFAEAVKKFRAKDFPGAEAAFRRVLEIDPQDGPSQFYLKFLAELHEHPLPDDWQGEVELKEK